MKVSLLLYQQMKHFILTVFDALSVLLCLTLVSFFYEISIRAFYEGETCILSTFRKTAVCYLNLYVYFEWRRPVPLKTFARATSRKWSINFTYNVVKSMTTIQGNISCSSCHLVVTNNTWIFFVRNVTR